MNTGHVTNNFIPEWFLAICLAVMLIIPACGKDEGASGLQRSGNDSIISEERMVLILTDLHLIEAALVVKSNRGEYHDSTAVFYYKGLFEKYGITREKLDRSLNYYRKNPEQYLRLYESVIQNLTDRENQFMKKRRS